LKEAKVSLLNYHVAGQVYNISAAPVEVEQPVGDTLHHSLDSERGRTDMVVVES